MAKREFRAIVTGGTDFEDYQMLRNTVLPMVQAHKMMHNKVVIITCGTGHGADALAEQLAYENGCEVQAMPTFKSEGKAAMFRRNRRIVEYAGAARSTGGAYACYAFHNGHHKPTAHLIQVATNELCAYPGDKCVQVINYESDPKHLRKELQRWVNTPDEAYDCEYEHDCVQA